MKGGGGGGGGRREWRVVKINILDDRTQGQIVGTPDEEKVETGWKKFDEEK